MTQKTIPVGDKWQSRIDVAIGATEIFPMTVPGKASIVVAPGTGGTATVSFSNSSPDDLAAGHALWAPWQGLGPDGVVSAVTHDEIPWTVMFVKITAAVAAARVEVAQ